MPYKLITNATLATMRDDKSYGLIQSAAIAIKGNTIEWLGPMSSIPDGLTDRSFERLDCSNRLITPGLIDCHTHLVYAGDRASEFEQRLQGTSYQEITRHGGGISSTVKQTRMASQEMLFAQANSRLSGLMNEGVTTLEIKSGYGLDRDNEIKMLKVARQLAETRQIRIQKTLLAAHALPPEYSDQKDAYIDHVCNDILPAAFETGLVDAVDGFCDEIAFSVEQMERVFDKAQSLGLALKLHTEQLSYSGGAVMAAQRGALSVDHLEHLRPSEASLLATHNTVAVLLPGAFYTLKETILPPIQALREHKVSMAVSTDLNPGSSPLNSLLLAMNMACTLFSLTPVEALAGTTISAAKALGMDNEIGSLEVGKSADLVIWDTDNPAMLSYQIGANPCLSTMISGKWRKHTLRDRA
jgi:imidazolonepropionase